MATNYVVQPGETLSGIGAKLGVDYNQITGFRSGNKNLIFPGESLTIPDKGTPTAPAATTPVTTTPSAPGYTPPDYSKIYATASSLVPQVDTSGLEASGAAIKESAAKSAESIRALTPTVQNIYTNLAAQLEKSKQQEVKRTETEKIQEVGKQAQQAAISGFETVSGYEAAISRAVAQGFEDKFVEISDRYGLKADQLKNEQIKDIATLEKEANAALVKGDESYATLTLNIVKLKQDSASLITQAAQTIMQAESTAEKNYYDRLYNDAILKLKDRELDLTAQKIAQDATKTKYDEQYIADAINAYAEGILKAPQIPIEIRSGVVTQGEALKKENERQERYNYPVIGGVLRYLGL